MNSQNLNHKTTILKQELPPKIFIARNSLLSDLLENVHIRTLHNFAWVIVVTSQLSYFLHNYLTYGRFSFNLELFKIAFSKPWPLFYISVSMFLAALLPYLGFVLWATIRHKIEKLSAEFFDRLSLILLISYIALYTYYFTFLIQQNDFKPPAAAALMLELVRLKMKLYAFVRSNVPRALKFTCHYKDEILYPSISKFMYFLFVPTLIYQDEYPRSKAIQWKKVAEHFGNFAGTLLLINMIMEQFITHFEIFSQSPFTWNRFIVLVIKFTPLSGMTLLTMFNLFFHCWSNAFAEMLRFSDRCFYEDFWTCTSYSRYFRASSTIVYDWLYVYIYKDFYEIVWVRNKVVAKAAVFLVSALYHELIMGFAFNVFSIYVFIILYCISFIIMIFSSNNMTGNFLFLVCTGIGSSIIVCTYGTHYYYQNIQ